MATFASAHPSCRRIYDQLPGSRHPLAHCAGRREAIFFRRFGIAFEAQVGWDTRHAVRKRAPCTVLWPGLAHLVAAVADDEDLLQAEVARGHLFHGRGVERTQAVGQHYRRRVQVHHVHQVVRLHRWVGRHKTDGLM